MGGSVKEGVEGRVQERKKLQSVDGCIARGTQ